MDNSLIKTAILVDGGFFIKRYFSEQGESFNVESAVNYLRKLIYYHTTDKELYRVFYYDCFPLAKKVHQPISKRNLDFEKSDYHVFKKKFFDSLKSVRKVALRMGELHDGNNWRLGDEKLQEILGKDSNIEDLKDSDFKYDISQKGVDMRLGLDISSLSFKKQVNKIILISGDSDFVPAAKLARREGIDFVLDPMWARVKPSLFEHIDGMDSYKEGKGKRKFIPISRKKPLPQ